MGAIGVKVLRGFWDGIVARSGNETAEEANWRALKTAWQPIAAGFKAIWWKAVALPEDVYDEDDFRASVSYILQSSIVFVISDPQPEHVPRILSLAH